jgi:glycosyltransferase involved in cell wall biosynthesis
MNRRLRVLYSFPGRLGRTGIGTTAWYQVQGLINEGVEVHVYCGTCDRPLTGAAEVVETFKVAGLRIPYRLLGTARVWSVHDALVARAIRRGVNVDAVHCWPLGAEKTLRAARANGIRSFLERPNTHTAFAYDVVAKELEKLGLKLPRGHSHAPNAERLAKEEVEYELTDHLMCPADFVVKTFLDRGMSPSKLVRTQYGYDPERFSAGSDRGRVNGGLVVGFVGSCEPRKGLHYALEAWVASGAGAKGEFLICGRFVPGYREILTTLLGDASVRDLGFTGDVAEVMRKCDVLILPSIEEGSALVTYEARACGCVLMVSDVTGARCEHMKEGLVHSAGDVAAIREHFAMLAKDRGLLERLRSESLVGVPGLTWQAAAKRLAQAYRECLAAANGGAKSR